METIKIKYSLGVQTRAGWRQVEAIANAKKISEKRVKILEVIDIDGDGCTGWASRTGATRQEYNLGYFAGNEQGKIKNLSSVEIVN